MLKLPDFGQDVPVIVDQILYSAIEQHASDIHFETYRDISRIRVRIDGVLYEQVKPTFSLARRINVRLKVMAGLDIAEKRLPQDGRFNFTVSESIKYDCRISTCPTINGEKIVVRVLVQADIFGMTIAELGLSNAQQELFSRHIHATQGMILVTGPTGSGKTITLYTALNLLNAVNCNISTVEDPVEINLSGVNQVEVNHKIPLDFAKVLRAFLRQDPDIIMVGEIRDLETAQIAMRAAQTGHLVLSTLHTNTAAESINRLSSMGVPGVNLIYSIKLIIAQRLLRKLCQNCKKSVRITKKVLKNYGFDTASIDSNDLNLFQAGSCENCNNGYRGRVGIFELLPLSKEINEMIMQNCNAAEITDKAKKLGMQSLHDAALQKVMAGVTSLDEVCRVLGF